MYVCYYYITYTLARSERRSCFENTRDRDLAHKLAACLKEQRLSLEIRLAIERVFEHLNRIFELPPTKVIRASRALVFRTPDSMGGRFTPFRGSRSSIVPFRKIQSQMTRNAFDLHCFEMIPLAPVALSARV